MGFRFFYVANNVFTLKSLTTTTTFFLFAYLNIVQLILPTSLDFHGNVTITTLSRNHNNQLEFLTVAVF